MKNNIEIKTRVNNYLEQSYDGNTQVLHYIEVLKEYGFDKIKEKIKNPLNKNIGAYYGCLLLRPSKVMQFDNPENPTIIEDLITNPGGKPINYAFKNECCGSFHSINNQNLVNEKCNKISNNAIYNGAEILVTCCPLCYYNLKKHTNVKVLFITEILAYALGIINEI